MTLFEVATIIIGSGLLTALAIVKAKVEKSRVRVKVKIRK